MPVLMRHMAAINRQANQYRTEKLAHLGLKGIQSIYLLQICRNPGLTQDRLAQNLAVDKSAVARQLAALEEMGYVRRETSPADKRVLLVHPTEKARQTLPEIRQVLSDWEDWISQDLTPEQRDVVVQALEKMRNRAKTWQEGG